MQKHFSVQNLGTIKSLRLSINKIPLYMRLSIVFLFCFLGLAQASESYAQKTKISIKLTNQTVGTILEEIEAQTDFDFFFNNKHVDLDRTVTISVDDKDVFEVLEQLFANTAVCYSVLDKKIILTTEKQEAVLQTVVIKGKVVNSLGEPIVGATVLEKGTHNGTVTDIDGIFELKVNANKTIEISYIGYVTTAISVKGKTFLNVTLKDDVELLDEVVVVGYGTQKKENLTGAVSMIKGSNLENRPVTKITQALQGTVANLNISSSNGGQPGATQSINIRGYSGLGTTNAPLIVIDGIQGGTLNYLEPSDIESITVLKDAASAAIYGSSAPFGAILVTTKQGRKDSKTKITYSNNFGLAQPINLPQMANSLDFAMIYNEAADNAGTTRPFTDENIQRIKDYQTGLMKDETIANPAKDEWYTWTGHSNNDWFDIFFKDIAFSQQHNLGISGGTNKTNYYVGVGYNQTGGLYEFGDDVYRRYSIRSNLSTNITKWMSFSARTVFSRATSDTPNTYSGKTGGNYMHQISRKWPTAALKNPNGEYSYPSDIRLMSEGGRTKGTTDKATLTGEFNINPLPGWNITANYTYDGNYYNNSSHLKTLYVTMPSGNTVLYAGTSPNSFSRTNQKTQRHLINAFTSYERTFGKHYLKTMVG